MASPAVSVVCVGMAGSGKTTFMQRINSYLHSKKTVPYVMNLDPAVHSVPFDSNIDIRDSINYKEVMKQYNLGPNGGILTSLNLFATKVDQIISLLEKRTAPNPDNPSAKPIEHILVDTPGQIEVFVWSASGSILLETLASSFPTVIAYVIDTPRASSTSTFMSNMLYACSILYKTKLPMILVFNKTDVKDADFAKEWMTDFDKFQQALRQEEESGAFGTEGGVGGFGAGSGYMGSLLNSMSLMLEEFYRHLSVVAVSSMTGDGVDEFFDAVETKRQEFERDYKPELERKKQEREENKSSQRELELGKLMKDMSVSGSGRRERKGPETGPETVSEAEDEEEDEIIKRGLADGEDFSDEDYDYAGPSAGDEQGLSERYKQALSGSQSAPSDADNSFTRLKLEHILTTLKQNHYHHLAKLKTAKVRDTLTDAKWIKVFQTYTYSTAAWLSLQSVPLMVGPSMIVAMLLDETRPASSIEIYFARCLGFSLLTIAVLTVMLTGSIPLTSSISEPVTTADSDPKAPYALPTLVVTSLFHAISAFYAYTWYVTRGQGVFAVAVGGGSILAFIGLWCVLFASSGGKISRRTGADKRTTGFPFANSEAAKKHTGKKIL
ncbi:GPN-loop GTPase 1 [Penicillium canariense]|uniref:GPN-loop GTPase 1 n=1 Tax=Penicillium canariense TaxID=189055 RepID=A0A9W9I7J7_9EURO|nr:GPN-loop GTPase 1 [Penicillium canariense]KAJ5168238.1 GPN-loop GTPase 1 [Penicillium canariense]